jgi:hypothetical protein
MWDSIQGCKNRAWYTAVVAGSMNEVNVVLVLEEGPSYGTATIVHVAHVVIETGKGLHQVLPLS